MTAATETPSVTRALGDIVTDFVSAHIKTHRVYVACRTGGEIRGWARRLQSLHPDYIIAVAETGEEFRRAIEPDDKTFNVLVGRLQMMNTGWRDYKPNVAITCVDTLTEPEAVQLAGRSRGSTDCAVYIKYQQEWSDDHTEPEVLTLEEPSNSRSEV